MSYDREQWRARLARIEEAGLLRSKPCLTGPQGVRVDVAGKTLINFASNDYLGLASRPSLRDAVIQSVNKNGVGSGASDIVCGHSHVHASLESELAEFTGRDKALLFSTGYMANLAVLSAFADDKALILQDKLNHASLIDGARLSGARSQRYLHNDPSSLDAYLTRFLERSDFASVLVATDGVFSMDGDIARVDALAEVCDRHNALLIVDDAHGLGVLGEGGRGTLEHFGVSQHQCPVLVGTFGKAFGTFGAFVAGPSDLIDYLEQVARPHIYTTAIPSMLASATLESLRVIRDEPALRVRLAELVQRFCSELSSEGFELLDSTTPIQGVVVGDNEKVILLSQYLRERGLLVGAIRPPTVPKGSARLRITLSASHSDDDLDQLFAALRSAKGAGVW